MTAKEYLKQAYLLDKQIQVEVKKLEQLREMRGTIQGCSYGEKIGTNPNRNLEAPFIKTIEKIWEYEKKIDGKINRLVDLRSEINTAIEKMENSEERLLLKYRYLKVGGIEISTGLSSIERRVGVACAVAKWNMGVAH